ncbi:MAG: histidine phosphatase family protein, partial [Caldilineaceae bacterium]|nr:histidine phosphatase family protein [Caldilineaceae bacterium]
MTRLYLITHAHTAADPAADARLWRLSPTGVDQAARLAAAPWWDDVDAIVLSSEAKTRLTVAPLLAQRDLPVVIDARFDELKRGGWCDDYAGQV